MKLAGRWQRWDWGGWKLRKRSSGAETETGTGSRLGGGEELFTAEMDVQRCRLSVGRQPCRTCNAGAWGSVFG